MFGTGALLSAVEAVELRADVRRLVADPEVGQSVTLYPASSRSVDHASGLVTYSGAAVTFTAVCGPAEVDDASGIRTGDVQILVSAGAASPAVGDQMQIGAGPVMVVKLIEPDPIGDMMTRVVVGRVA